MSRFGGLLLALALGSGILPITASLALTQGASAEAAARHLVAYNRLGPNWAQRERAVPILIAHRNLYRRLADEGEIVFSGRFDGEPALGMAVFAHGVDEARIRRLLESDPAVAGGYISLELRHFDIAFGALARPPAGPRE